MKRPSSSLVIRKCKVKPQFNAIIYPPEGLKCKTQMMPTSGQSAGPRCSHRLLTGVGVDTGNSIVGSHCCWTKQTWCPADLSPRDSTEMHAALGCPETQMRVPRSAVHNGPKSGPPPNAHQPCDRYTPVVPSHHGALYSPGVNHPQLLPTWGGITKVTMNKGGQTLESAHCRIPLIEWTELHPTPFIGHTTAKCICEDRNQDSGFPLGVKKGASWCWPHASFVTKNVIMCACVCVCVCEAPMRCF